MTSKKKIREVLKRLYNSGYGITGKSKENTEYVADQALQEIQRIRIEDLPEESKHTDEPDFAYRTNSSEIRWKYKMQGFNKAIQSMKERIE